MYEEVTEYHISELTSIIAKDIGVSDKAVGELGRSLLILSAEKIMDRWKTGKKYLRTLHALKAMPNYPEEIFKLSVSIDAIVNNLDDLIDENLDNEAKTLYVVEVIKLFSMFNYQNADQETKNLIANYFNKLISIALLEKFYYGLIKSGHNAERPLEHVLPLYDCRSLDMDIFVELPMMKTSGGVKSMKDVVEVARCFRALNLLKKDISDFQHDKEQGQSTLMTIFYHDKMRLRSIIETMVVHYLDKSRKLDSGDEFKGIVENYQRMSEEEAKEVLLATEALLGIS